MKIRWIKLIVCGIIFLIISTIVRLAEEMLTIKYYMMPEFFGIWNKIVIPSIASPTLGFQAASAFISFITGMSVAAFYDFIKGLFKISSWKRIFGFTVLVLLLSFFFFTLTPYLLFNMPAGLLIWWVGSSFVVYFLSAIAFEKILK